MDQNDIAIIGYGVVGRGMGRVFPSARIVDPHLKPVDMRWLQERMDEPGARTYRLAFVCVPTDSLPDGGCDTSIVEQAINDNDAEVFVIKSTVPPGTTRGIARATGKACVFSPEFDGNTPSSKDIDQHFVILGGQPAWTSQVTELYKAIKPATFHICKTNSETAELVKYAENAFLATKVTFFNEFYRLCETAGVDVDEFREALLLDPRIGREHSFVYRDHPWWESKCCDKDLPALVAWAESVGTIAPLVQAVVAVNGQHKVDQA